MKRIGQSPIASVTGPLGTGGLVVAWLLYTQIANISDGLGALEDQQDDLAATVVHLTAMVDAQEGARAELTQLRADFEQYRAQTDQRLAQCEETISEPRRGRR